VVAVAIALAAAAATAAGGAVTDEGGCAAVRYSMFDFVFFNAAHLGQQEEKTSKKDTPHLI